MKLLDIPSEVWQRILVDWISLSELVRSDLATTSFKSSNPSRFGYADHLFTFDDNGNLSPEHLDKLLSWLQSRNVHLRQISVRTSESDHQWNQIFKWTGSTVRNLIISLVSSTIVESAAVFCNNLEELHLHKCSTNNSQLHSILANNASTLRFFQLLDIGLTDSLTSELPKMNLSELSLITSENSVMIPIVGKCAELSVLHLQGSNLDEELAHCIANSCKKLTKLHLDGLNYIEDDTLPTIANGCQLIEGLQINDCEEFGASGLGEAIHAWPNLQYLLLDVWSEDLLIAVATYGCPSLRVMEILEHDSDYVDEVTVRGFRALTKSCPSLEAMSIGTLSEHADVSSSSVLEFCPKLQYLEIGGGVLASLVDEILNSASVYCPNLHTLNLINLSNGCSPTTINFVLQKCTHLRVLMLSHVTEYEIADPLLERRVEVIRGKQVCLAKWVAPV